MEIDINKIKDERLTEDEKMELIADYLENGGGGSSKLRVKVKVDYVPTTAAEIIDTSATGVAGYGYIYVATTGVSFEDADGEPVSVEDVTAAVREGNIELISFDHLGDFAIKNGDAVTVKPATFSTTSLAASYACGVSELEEGLIISGSLWMVDVNLPFMVGTAQGGQLMAAVGVVYQQ